MKKLKKIISLLCVVGIMSSMITVSASNTLYDDLNSDFECYQPVERLNELGIIGGYEDNTYRPWRSVTRAEFCKIIVAMLDKTAEAKSISASSAFDDVNSVKWCIPYVNYLTGNGIIKGYADATFKPNNVITYAEAATILCRILGYNEESVGYSWPANYINETEALKLAGNMEFSAGDSITRAAMAIMADKTLFTYVNGSSQTTFLESVGFGVNEDSYVIATNKEDSSLKSDEIRLTDGKYTCLSKNAKGMVGNKGTAVFNKDKELVLFVPETYGYVLDAVVTKISGNTIEYKTKNSAKGTYTVNSDFEIYYGGSKTTFGAVSSRLTVGTSVKLYSDKAGEWDFAMVVDEGSNIVPVRATKNYTSADKYLEGIAIDYNDLTVYKDNKTASVADIEVNDVIYYNTQTNTMDVYNKKVTGIYNEALPSKAYVTSIDVGGNVYSINQRVDTSALDASSGSFAIGDRVTLLLGENDEVCFAVELTDSASFNYGVLLKTYKETSKDGEKEGSSCTMASIFMSDGNVYEYEAEKNYSSYVGDLVKINYDGGVVSLTGVSSYDAYGEIDYQKRTIGGKSFLKDAVIFHRLSDEDDSNVSIEKLDFDTLGTTKITQNQLITSVSANSFGDIAVMYVCDLPSSYDYGIFLGYKSSGGDPETATSSGVYTIYSDSNTVQYQSNYKTNVSGAVAFKLSNGQLSDIKTLNLIASAGTIQAVEGGRIMVNSKIYKMDDNVQIVNVSGTSYKTMSVNELAKSKVSKVTLYSDTSDKENAVIRVVTVTMK